MDEKKKTIRKPKAENGQFLYYCTVPGCTFGTDNFFGMVGHNRLKHGINIKKNTSPEIVTKVPIKEIQVEAVKEVQTITESPKGDVMEVDRSLVEQMIRSQGELTAKDIALMQHKFETKMADAVRQGKADAEIAANKSVNGLNVKLGEMETSVQSLRTAETANKEASTGYAEQITALQAELASRPSEERVKELMQECMTDPGGSACQFLAGMARQSAAELQPEGLHIAGEDGREGILPELTWDEVLNCTEGCKDGICEALPKHPDLISDALKKLKEQNPEKFAEITTGMGLAKPVEKKASKLDSLFW